MYDPLYQQQGEHLCVILYICNKRSDILYNSDLKMLL